jgi:Putative phage tail protein
MAQLALAAVGAAIGGAIAPGIVTLGLTGASIGWIGGSLVGSALFRPRFQPPAPGDLSSPKIEYGSPIPYVFGTVVTSGAVAWISELRATEVEAETGKGGGSQVVGYTYSADIKFVIAKIKGAHDIVAMTRVWRNGDLVWSARTGADADTVPASANTEHWDDIELRVGGASQDPWTPYETAVGSSLAVADRWTTTICITNARFGNSKTPPVYRFEVITAGSSAPGDVLLLTNVESGAVTDESGYAHAYTLSAMRADTPGRYGSYAIWNDSGTPGSSATVVPGAGTVSFSLSEDFTAECAVYVDSAQNAQIRLLDLRVNGGDQIFEARLDCSSDGSCDLELSFLTNPQEQFGITLAYAAWNHVEIDYEAATQTCTLYFNGVALLSSVFSGTLPTYTSITSMQPVYVDDTAPDGWCRVDGIRYTRRRLRHTEAFDVPTTAPIDDGGTTWTPGTVDLDDVVGTLLNRTPITSSLRDVTGLNGVPVRGFAATGNIRASLEQLAACYHFGAVCSDKLYFRRRAASSALTIPYADLGAGVDQARDEALTLDRGNDDEVPRRISLSYVNINADHDVSTVTGDRGEGRVSQADTAQVSIVATPSEAQAIVDAWVLDRRAAATRFTTAVSDYYARLEPTDPLTLTDSDGTTYRARIVSEDFASGVKSLELVLDDASVFTQPGIASDYTTPTINVPNPGETTLDLMDIPMLRDADNDAGFYVAVSGGSSWPGAVVAESGDGVTYTQRLTITANATRGRATTALADWTGGNVMDHQNTVTIQINGTAASFTDDQVLAGTARAWLIGDEIIVPRTATLVSTGVYTLSNLMRARQGTEWATGTHEVGERVVALDASTLRRLTREAGQLDVEYQFKAPTIGRSLATTSARAFTDTGEALRPLSPADVEVDRDSSNNATITVRRRTRLSHRFLREGIDTPLGEADESYSVDAYTDGTYTTVAATFTFTGASGSFTAAAQTTAGLTPGDPLYLAVHQLSAVVGRGHEKRAAA